MRFLVLFVLFASSFAVFAQAGESPRHLSVSGSGHVDAVPDMATISIGVEHQAKAAGQAMAEVSAATASVLARLGDAGIAARDMQTSGFSLGPVYDYSGDGPARLTGFRASNQVTARLRDLGQLGTVLDAVVRDGANQIGGLSFGMAETAALEDEARRLAVADARHKAEVLARAAGVELGAVISITSGGAAPVPLPMMEIRAVAAEPVPVAAGEVSISASVQMVFAIND